jgi:Ni/Co efflux regulator RcnB
MQTTPLWVPIVVAGVGVLGTIVAGIAGVLITQRQADRRDAKTWERERERERERWAREDESRTFEHRRESYADFYDALKDMARTAYDHGYGLTELLRLPPDPPRRIREGRPSPSGARLSERDTRHVQPSLA